MQAKLWRFFPHDPRFAAARDRLRLPTLDKALKKENRTVHGRLVATLEHLESLPNPICLPKVLNSNLDLLRHQFSFNRAECLIFAWAVLLRIDNDLSEAAAFCDCGVDLTASLAKMLCLRPSDVARAVAPGSRLRRSNLIDAFSGGNLRDAIQLRRGSLRKMAQAKLHHVDELLNGMVTTSPAPTLSVSDYPHLQPDIFSLIRLVDDAITNTRTGVNVLLYGPPGTGKSELVRVIAKELGVTLLDVADTDEDGEALPPSARLSGAIAGLFLLGRRRSMVCFDEVDGIFNDINPQHGFQTTAELRKSSFNRLLEQNQVPVFWVANSVRFIDPAFVRRFDLVVRLEAPPQSQRMRLLERECGGLVPRPQLKRLARLECLTPAVVTRASQVVRRIVPGSSEDPQMLLKMVLDGVLQAQRHPPLSISLSKTDASEFVPELCNASEDLQRLARGIAKTGSGRICLYGPPGTGKTAFGRWLADTLDKPLLLKRVSDLQSPFLGEMERNLAKAFASAKREGAVLQIDEIDSFLQDRRQAQRSWEVSQVNEFLTQLESYEGLLIASTNLMDNLDQAAMRRFDYKVRMDYLRPDQVLAMLDQQLRAWNISSGDKADHDRSRLMTQRLTPGDFAVVARRHRIMPFVEMGLVVDALCAEASIRRPTARQIGFVHN